MCLIGVQSMPGLELENKLANFTHLESVQRAVAVGNEEGEVLLFNYTHPHANLGVHSGGFVNTGGGVCINGNR